MNSTALWRFNAADQSDRNQTGMIAISTAGWAVGDHKFNATGQDASGRATEVDGPTLTVEETENELPAGAVAFFDENENGEFDNGEETYTVGDLETLTVDGTVVVSRDAIMEDSSLDRIGIDAERIVVENGVEMRTTGGGQNIELISGSELLLTNAEIRTEGGGSNIDIQADSELDADGATIVTDGFGSSLDLTSGEAMNINSAEIQSIAPITIDAGGQLDAQDASIVATGGDSDVNINSGGNIIMSDAIAEGINVNLDSDGFINIDRTSLAAASYGELNADLTGSADLFVDDAEFTSGGNPTDLFYGPGQSVNVIGEPAVGGY